MPKYSRVGHWPVGIALRGLRARTVDAYPDAQWRLLFALARYGGLRTPSESLALKWEHVDWEHGRMTVPSPKTERYPGGESRLVPLFPELGPYLMDVIDQAEPGTEYVITRYRSGAEKNLRTTPTKIIRRAGMKPWPKLWQNQRSTRETKLAERFPVHVVCAWIGNSRPVGRHALPSGHRRTLPADRRGRLQRAAKSAAAGYRRLSH